MLVLGIDPGSRVTGYGLVHRQRGRYRLAGAGVVRTRPSETVPQRLACIHAGLVEVIQEYKVEGKPFDVKEAAQITIKILEGLRASYEEHHNVEFTEQALVNAANYAPVVHRS